MKKLLSLILATLLLLSPLTADVASAASTGKSTTSTVRVNNSKTNAANTTNVKAANDSKKTGTNTDAVQIEALGPQLSNIRYGDSTTRLRIVLDVSDIPEYTVSKENNNTRLVLNMNGLTTALSSAPATKSVAVKDIILGTYGSDTIQLIVDMPVALETKVYKLANPNRLVIDIQKEYEQEFNSTIFDGLNYTKYVRVDSRGMVTAYALDVDRNKFNLEFALAGGSISAGRARVKNIARSNNAVAAINGGYFASDGSLIGNTRLNGQTAGTTYFTRTALGFMADGSLKIAKSEYYGEIKLGDKIIYPSGINTERGANNTIVYNSLFGSYTGTNEYGMEYIVQKGKVIAINQANSYIPADGYVISVHGTAQDAFKDVKIGDSISFADTMGTEFEGAKTVIGAGPELLRNGTVHVTATEEQFPSDIARGRAPRTAVGIKPDGKVILLVIDGRQSHSIGATLAETAEMLQKFGAVNGYNLDGGGSSELVLQNETMNSPSDGSERPVGSALLVTRKN